MEEKAYTHKELYELVAEYAKAANDERFDMSVGDFVDWVASREDDKKEYAFDTLMARSSDNPPYTHTFSVQNVGDEPCECKIGVIVIGNWFVHFGLAAGTVVRQLLTAADILVSDHYKQDGTVEKIFCEKHSQIGHVSTQEDKPALPEKLEDPCYVQYGTESEREMLLLIVKLIRKQNEILDYLSRKEQ